MDSQSNSIRRETRFRIPCSTEREIGLWVDRIGIATTNAQPENLRILGQYAAVAVDAGTGTCRTTDSKISVQPGDVIFMTPKAPVNYYPDHIWTTRWIVWNGPDAAKLSSLGCIGNAATVIRGAGHCVERTLYDLQPQIGNTDLASVLERKCIILNLILDLYKVSRQLTKAMSSDTKCRQATDYIERRYHRTLRIPEIAAEVGLSEPHFRRVFKAFTGMTPQQYITAVRIARAQEFLVAGMATKSVADRCGFSDVFYFMSVFKKTTGMPPGAFARNSALQ